MHPPPDTAATRDLMDRIYGGQRHIYDVTRKFYLLGRDELIADLRPPAAGAVLEVGCGTGRNLIAAAHAYPSARFFGVDLSSAMLKTARKSITSAGLGHRIRVAQADATSFTAADYFGCETFDRVFFSYSLSMIPAWQEAVGNGMRHIAPQGRLLVVDFGRQERLPAWFRYLLYAWLDRFHVTPRKNLNEILQVYSAMRDGKTSIVSLYRGYSVIGRIVLP